MIYTAFTLWLLLIVFMAYGIYRLWSTLLKPVTVDWILLPATAVAEIAYIAGRLITGAEIRHAKITPTDANGRGDSQATTEASKGIRFVSPLIATFLALIACGGGIIVVDAMLGDPVMSELAPGEASETIALAKSIPTSWRALWNDHLNIQFPLVRKMCEALTRLDWRNWKVPLFIYLSVCLSIRLAPARRELRMTLAGVVVAAGVIAAIGGVSSKFHGAMDWVWPLLTFVWSSMLLLLIITLLVHACVGLTGVLRGKAAGKRGSSSRYGGSRRSPGRSATAGDEY